MSVLWGPLTGLIVTLVFGAINASAVTFESAEFELRPANQTVEIDLNSGESMDYIDLAVTSGRVRVKAIHLIDRENQLIAVSTHYQEVRDSLVVHFAEGNYQRVVIEAAAIVGEQNSAGFRIKAGQYNLFPRIEGLFHYWSPFDTIDWTLPEAANADFLVVRALDRRAKINQLKIEYIDQNGDVVEEEVDLYQEAFERGDHVVREGRRNQMILEGEGDFIRFPLNRAYRVSKVFLEADSKERSASKRRRDEETKQARLMVTFADQDEVKREGVTSSPYSPHREAFWEVEDELGSIKSPSLKLTSMNGAGRLQEIQVLYAGSEEFETVDLIQDVIASNTSTKKNNQFRDALPFFQSAGRFFQVRLDSTRLIRRIRIMADSWIDRSKEDLRLRLEFPPQNSLEQMFHIANGDHEESWELPVSSVFKAGRIELESVDPKITLKELKVTYTNGIEHDFDILKLHANELAVESGEHRLYFSDAGHKVVLPLTPIYAVQKVFIKGFSFNERNGNSRLMVTLAKGYSPSANYKCLDEQGQVHGNMSRWRVRIDDFKDPICPGGVAGGNKFEVYKQYQTYQCQNSQIVAQAIVNDKQEGRDPYELESDEQGCHCRPGSVHESGQVGEGQTFWSEILDKADATEGQLYQEVDDYSCRWDPGRKKVWKKYLYRCENGESLRVDTSLEAEFQTGADVERVGSCPAPKDCTPEVTGIGQSVAHDQTWREDTPELYEARGEDCPYVLDAYKKLFYSQKAVYLCQNNTREFRYNDPTDNLVRTTPTHNQCDIRPEGDPLRAVVTARNCHGRIGPPIAIDNFKRIGSSDRFTTFEGSVVPEQGYCDEEIVVTLSVLSEEAEFWGLTGKLRETYSRGGRTWSTVRRKTCQLNNGFRYRTCADEDDDFDPVEVSSFDPINCQVNGYSEDGSPQVFEIGDEDSQTVITSYSVHQCHAQAGRTTYTCDAGELETERAQTLYMTEYGREPDHPACHPEDYSCSYAADIYDESGGYVGKAPREQTFSYDAAEGRFNVLVERHRPALCTEGKRVWRQAKCRAHGSAGNYYTQLEFIGGSWEESIEPRDSNNLLCQPYCQITGEGISREVNEQLHYETCRRRCNSQLTVDDRVSCYHGDNVIRELSNFEKSCQIRTIRDETPSRFPDIFTTSNHCSSQCQAFRPNAEIRAHSCWFGGENFRNGREYLPVCEITTYRGGALNGNGQRTTRRQCQEFCDNLEETNRYRHCGWNDEVLRDPQPIFEADRLERIEQANEIAEAAHTSASNAQTNLDTATGLVTTARVVAEQKKGSRRLIERINTKYSEISTAAQTAQTRANEAQSHADEGTIRLVREKVAEANASAQTVSAGLEQIRDWKNQIDQLEDKPDPVEVAGEHAARALAQAQRAQRIFARVQPNVQAARQTIQNKRGGRGLLQQMNERFGELRQARDTANQKAERAAERAREGRVNRTNTLANEAKAAADNARAKEQAINPLIQQINQLPAKDSDRPGDGGDTGGDDRPTPNGAKVCEFTRPNGRTATREFNRRRGCLRHCANVARRAIQNGQTPSCKYGGQNINLEDVLRDQIGDLEGELRDRFGL